MSAMWESSTSTTMPSAVPHDKTLTHEELSLMDEQIKCFLEMERTGEDAVNIQERLQNVTYI